MEGLIRGNQSQGEVLLLDAAEDERVPDGVSEVTLLETINLRLEGSLEQGLLEGAGRVNRRHDLENNASDRNNTGKGVANTINTLS